MPYPPENGTNQRIYSMVNFLKNEYRVGLVIPEYHPDVSRLSSMFDYIFYSGKYLHSLAKLQRYSLRKVFSLFFFFFFHRHLIKYANNPLGRYNVFAAVALCKICLQEKPSLIIVQKVINSVLSTAIARKFNIPVVIDTHDLYKLRLNDQLEKTNINLKQHNKITSQHEKDLLQLYNALIAIQYQEENILKHHFPDKKIVTALHPAPSTYIQEDTAHIYSESPVLLFVASASTHNIDAINYFIEKQFVYVLKFYPNVKLNICGDISKHINYAHSNIQVLGRVHDLKSFYQKAAIVINPVRYGSGLKIKTVEALAFSKCLITTPNGSEGLPHIDHVIVCREAEYFGNEIVNLLNDRKKIRIFEERACTYTNTYLTADRCYAALSDLIGELIK
jgi:hypothetical protein